MQYSLSEQTKDSSNMFFRFECQLKWKQKSIKKSFAVNLLTNILAKFFFSVSYVARVTHEFAILLFLCKLYNQGSMPTNIDCGAATPTVIQFSHGISFLDLSLSVAWKFLWLLQLLRFTFWKIGRLCHDDLYKTILLQLGL